MSLDERSVDAFTIRMLGDSIMVTTWNGQASERDVYASRDYAFELRARSPGGVGLGIIDASQAEGVAPKARAALRKVTAEKPWDYIAIVGTTKSFEVFSTLTTRAMKLMSIDTAEVAFFEELDAARSWLESQLESVVRGAVRA